MRSRKSTTAKRSVLVPILVVERQQWQAIGSCCTIINLVAHHAATEEATALVRLVVFGEILCRSTECHPEDDCNC